MPIPILRYQYQDFQMAVCLDFAISFRMEKRKLAVEIKTLHDFPYILMHIRLVDVISSLQKGKIHLAFICSKSTIQTLELDIKHV